MDVSRLLSRTRGRRAAKPEQLPSWMAKQVDAQLAPFIESGITQAMIDSVESCFEDEYHDHYVRFCVKAGELSWRADVSLFPDYVRERFDVMSDALSVLAPDLADLEFVLYLGDGFTGWSSHCSAPVFAFSRHRHLDKSALLLPDPLTLSTSPTVRRQVRRGNKIHGWDTKREVAFFRGATTGGPFDVENYRAHARFRVVELSREFPDLVDASFTEVQLCDQRVETIIRENAYLGGAAEISEHMRYKYLVVVDGHASPWQRLFWGMFSNSVLFKQESDCIGWFDDAAEPGVHYVALQPDLSDLTETVLWARQHDDEAKAISQRARKFARVSLSDTKVLGYMRLLLNSYARLSSS